MPASRVEVIPPGVDLAAWRRPDRPANPVPRVLFVGGGFARKGGDLLLRWFAERGRGRCELHLVTGDAAAEGPHPLGVHVHRGLGPNDEALRRLFWSSDVFALPSRSEPFGIVCAEAMAAGLPVVASAVGGITDIVEDGVSGRLVPADDPGALGAALDELLGSEPRRRALGDAGRRIAERRFDERVNGSRTLEIVKRSAERVRGAVGDVAGAP